MFVRSGGENHEYKNKLRTLYFNLKDARNPELRRRVVHGEISPDQLVSMSPKELASQELVAWRQKKKEELLQATVLDEDAAAQFSTAAALKQLEAKREERIGERDTDMALPAAATVTHDLSPPQVLADDLDSIRVRTNSITRFVAKTVIPSSCLCKLLPCGPIGHES